jgi:hypothetical protein
MPTANHRKLPLQPWPKRLNPLPLPLPVFIFRVFSPKITCQAPKSPNQYGISEIHLAF